MSRLELPEEPLVGALLRLPAQAIHRRIIAELNRVGDDVTEEEVARTGDAAVGKWVDVFGGGHVEEQFADSLDAVPAEYRKQAQPMGK